MVLTSIQTATSSAAMSMAHIHVLPVELLLVIISHLAPEDAPPHKKPSTTPYRSLMLVCRRWRAMIIQTALFWACVKICPPWNDCDIKFSRFMWSLDLQLARSAKATLNLRLSLRRLSFGRASKVLALLMKHDAFERCQHLELEPEDHDLSSIQLEDGNLEDGKFEALQTLKITGGVEGIIMPLLERTALNVRHLILGCEYPQLAKKHPSLLLRVSALELEQCPPKSLALPPALRSLRIPRLPATAEAPQSHLTRLTVTELDLMALNTLSFAKLEYLELDIFADDVSMPVVLPGLKHLRFNGTQMRYWVTVFRPLARIEAPALISLHIGYPLHSSMHSLLKSVVNSPTYQLSPLELSLQATLTPETIHDVLVRSPRVRRLDLTFQSAQQPWNNLAYSLMKQKRGATTKCLELCSDLEVLDISLEWKLDSEEERKKWVGYAQRIMNGRRESGLRKVRIHWKNGGAVVAD